jgi:hypothetical protein
MTKDASDPGVSRWYHEIALKTLEEVGRPVLTNANILVLGTRDYQKRIKFY